MICISVSPTSRQLAKVDILNASRQCDLIELCLDQFIKEPDIGEMISGVDKPFLISCRRPEQGGKFEGNEEDRLKLLRTAIVAGPAYVELDFAIAKKIPRFGKTKRVVSYTRLEKPIGKFDELFKRAKEVDADILKVTSPTPTLDAAWPMLIAISKKHDLPVVGMGLGMPGQTFTLLCRKYGAPWTYAALEKGMESYEGQPTVDDLNTIYDWSGIQKKTRFVGLVGFGEASVKAAKLLNKGFQQKQTNLRCLPFKPGKLDRLSKMLEALKINALFVSPVFGSEIIRFAKQQDKAVKETGFVDFLVKKKESGWKAYNALSHVIYEELVETLHRQKEEENPFTRRHTLIIGTGEITLSVAKKILEQKGMMSITAPNNTVTQRWARELDIRHIPFAKVYDTSADVVIFTDASLQTGITKNDLNPSFLQPDMTVLDLSRYPEPSSFHQEAKERGCQLVDIDSIFKKQIARQFKAITGEVYPDNL
ncbi:3-dehydroquinate dehydratase I / Shikimate 5-dehydrogenase I alpha [hydrothermal vent metagenome]|uniref:3-dehydroquinate dehydratase I / Shikimate 5-dehydrogenase I alpha n=1 Tax=hydrothermal vent metagenome TaxID=652676 RepID=A0A3B1DZR6_9ZZZZ